MTIYLTGVFLLWIIYVHKHAFKLFWTSWRLKNNRRTDGIAIQFSSFQVKRENFGPLFMFDLVVLRYCERALNISINEDHTNGERTHLLYRKHYASGRIVFDTWKYRLIIFMCLVGLHFISLSKMFSFRAHLSKLSPFSIWT